MRSNWMIPSTMSQILGACDPASLLDRNFGLINQHWGLALAMTDDNDDDTSAPGGVQANFDAVAQKLGLQLYPVQTSSDPEATCQMNFEIINGAW